MKTVWSEQASDSLLQISSYIKEEFGVKYQQKFLLEISRVSTLLEKTPNLGQTEPLLKDAPVLYRSIVVNRINKIVYYVGTEFIEIVALWDVRREPDALTKETI